MAPSRLHRLNSTGPATASLGSIIGKNLMGLTATSDRRQGGGGRSSSRSMQDWELLPELPMKPEAAVAAVAPYVEAAYAAVGMGDAFGMAATFCNSFAKISESEEKGSRESNLANSVIRELTFLSEGPRGEREIAFINWRRFDQLARKVMLRDDDANFLGLTKDGGLANVESESEALDFASFARNVELSGFSVEVASAVSRVKPKPLLSLRQKDQVRLRSSSPDFGLAVLLMAMDNFGYRQGGFNRDWPELDLRFASPYAAKLAKALTQDLRDVLLSSDGFVRGAIFHTFVTDPETGQAFTSEDFVELYKEHDVIADRSDSASPDYQRARSAFNGAPEKWSKVEERWAALMAGAASIQEAEVTAPVETIHGMTSWWDLYKTKKAANRQPRPDDGDRRERKGGRRRDRGGQEERAEEPAAAEAEADSGDLLPRPVLPESQEELELGQAEIERRALPSDLEPEIANVIQETEAEGQVDQYSDLIGTVWAIRGVQYRVERSLPHIWDESAEIADVAVVVLTPWNTNGYWDRQRAYWIHLRDFNVFRAYGKIVQVETEEESLGGLVDNRI